MDDPLPRATRINDQYAKRYRLEQRRLMVTWSSQVRFFEMEVLRHQTEATARWKDGTCDVERNATAGARWRSQQRVWRDETIRGGTGAIGTGEQRWAQAKRLARNLSVVDSGLKMKLSKAPGSGFGP